MSSFFHSVFFLLTCLVRYLQGGYFLFFFLLGFLQSLEIPTVFELSSPDLEILILVWQYLWFFWWLRGVCILVCLYIFKGFLVASATCNPEVDKEIILFTLFFFYSMQNTTKSEDTFQEVQGMASSSWLAISFKIPLPPPSIQFSL